MGTWSIVKPEATENLMVNPSIEEDDSGYTAVNSASLSRVSSEQAIGLYSLEVTPAANTTSGVYGDVSLEANTEYTFSFSIKGANGVDYEAYLYANGAQVGSAVEFTGDGSWRRYSVTATTGGTATGGRVYIRKNNDASTAAFYVDALQVEAKGYATTYCDGDQDGCSWTAAEHSSTSERDAQSAAGGRVVDLSGSDYGFTVSNSIGVGMPPVELIDTLPAQSDGADHQRTITRPRTFQLVGKINGTGWSDLLSKRLNLIDLLNPHRLSTDQPVQLRYTVNNKTIAIKCRYEAGLEKAQLSGNAAEYVALRFKAQSDPYWYSTLPTANNGSGIFEAAAGLTVQSSLANANYIVQRLPDGTWQVPGTGAGLNGTVYAIEQLCNGDYVFGGAFTTANGVTVNRLVRWDGAAYYDLASGTGQTVRGLELSPHCTLYVSGPETFGGVGASFLPIAGEYDLDTDSWTLLQATGATSENAVALTVDPATGYPWITTFLVGVLEEVAGWNGASWDEYNFSGNVSDILFGPDGALYGVGSSGGSAIFRRLDGGSFTSLSVPSGVELLERIAAGPDGALYAIGRFSSSTEWGMFRWNGTTWEQIGGKFDSTASAIAIDPVTGDIYVGGDFTEIGGVAIPDGVAKYTGGAWTPVGVQLPGSAEVQAIHFAPNGTMTLGYDTSGAATAPVLTTVNNEGSAKAYPKIMLAGPGRIYSLINHTTQQEIHFNLELLDGETIVLDLSPGKKSLISEFRGSLASAILPGSDLENFALMPGENSISVFIDSGSATASMRWLIRHWSFDGVV